MRKFLMSGSWMLFFAMLLMSCKKNNVPQQAGTQTITGSQVIHSGILTGGELGDIARGNISVLQGSGKRFLQFSNFSSSNGPDVHVYLSATVGSNSQPATDYKDLGLLKFTSGSFNYELADDIDFNRYPHVVIWCAQFRIQFGYTTLIP